MSVIDQRTSGLALLAASTGDTSQGTPWNEAKGEPWWIGGVDQTSAGRHWQWRHPGETPVTARRTFVQLAEIEPEAAATGIHETALPKANACPPHARRGHTAPEKTGQSARRAC